jgi:hypothetical protein
LVEIYGALIGQEGVLVVFGDEMEKPMQRFQSRVSTSHHGGVAIAYCSIKLQSTPNPHLTKPSQPKGVAFKYPIHPGTPQV